MSQTCKQNSWVIYGLSIAIQVTFIFIFLTVFFFSYVQIVEKEEFQKQLYLIVDNIMQGVEQNILNAHDINKQDKIVIINGIINTIQEKIVMDSRSDIENVMKQNKAVKMKAFKSLVVSISIITLFILLVGFCAPVKHQIKEAILIVVFVGITEYAFLQLIAKNYISADPNKVKRSFGKAIQDWVKNNK